MAGSADARTASRATRSGAQQAIGSRPCWTPARRAGAAARERAEQLVREVVDLYGAGLERIVELAADVGDDPAGDGSPPTTWSRACCWCTACTRTTSSAGWPTRWTVCGRTWVRMAGTSTCSRSPTTACVRLQFAGSCKSCPSSAVTLELAVEDAVRAAAPEIASIEVVAAEPSGPAPVIPAESLMSRTCIRTARQRRRGIRCPSSPTWRPARSAGSWSRARRCWPAGSATSCSPTATAAAAATTRWPVPRCTVAGCRSVAVLRCPRCHAHFDVVHAGAGVDGTRHRAIWIRSRCWCATACCRWRCAPTEVASGMSPTSLRRAGADPGNRPGAPSRPGSGARCAPSRSPTSISTW